MTVGITSITGRLHNMAVALRSGWYLIEKPFDNHDEALDHLNFLRAVGAKVEMAQDGAKFIVHGEAPYLLH